MATYTNEAADLAVLFVLRPSFNASQTVTAANAHINYRNRVKNDSDSADVIERETKTASFDMIAPGYSAKTVNVAGIGNITYLQIAAAIRKVADAERLLLP